VKSRHFGAMIGIGLFWSIPVGHAGEAPPSCAANALLGTPTTLVFPGTSACANGVLPGKAAFEILAKQISDLKPNSSLLDTYEMDPWNAVGPSHASLKPRVTTDNCPAVKIVTFEEHNHRALIQCQCPVVPKGAKSDCDSKKLLGKTWINLDYLACYPKNVKLAPRVIVTKGCDPKAVAGTSTVAQAMQKSVEKIASVYGSKLLKRAEEQAKVIKELIRNDSQKLYSAYDKSSKSDKELHEAFTLAEKRLTEYREQSKSLYGTNCDGVPADMMEAQWVQGQRTCRLIRLSLSEFQKLKADALKGAGPGASPEAIGAKYRQWIKTYEGFGRAEEGGDLDQLAFRMILFHGLKDPERATLLKPAGKDSKGLALVRVAREHAVKGKPDLLELHDGYVFGGARAGKDGVSNAQADPYDCSEFIASLLKDRRSSDVPSTAQFATIARVLHKESGASLPQEDWANLKHCFLPVKIREGEPLHPGDILIRRIDSSTTESNSEHEGHLAIVKSFDPQSGNIKTVEAAGSTMSTLGYNERPLYEASCEVPADGSKPSWTPVRSDLRALRFKPDPAKGCPLQAPKLD